MSVSPMCDKYPEEVAICHFAWPWTDRPDSSGLCGPRYRAELTQIARNIKREILFSPLPAVLPPLGQDERTQLLAAKMSAEVETKVTQERASKLADSVAELKNELRHEKALRANAESEARAANERAQLAIAERDEAAAKAGALVLEVESLKLLAG